MNSLEKLKINSDYDIIASVESEVKSLVVSLEAKTVEQQVGISFNH